jgi:hypothetical protein
MHKNNSPRIIVCQCGPRHIWSHILLYITTDNETKLSIDMRNLYSVIASQHILGIDTFVDNKYIKNENEIDCH